MKPQKIKVEIDATVERGETQFLYEISTAIEMLVNTHTPLCVKSISIEKEH